jgi:hypothetical protein
MARGTLAYKYGSLPHGNAHVISTNGRKTASQRLTSLGYAMTVKEAG